MNGPVSTEDEGSVSVGGADDQQQKDEEDAQHKQEDSNTPESPVKRCKRSSACKFMPCQYTFSTAHCHLHSSSICSAGRSTQILYISKSRNTVV